MGYIGKVPADVLIDPHVDSAAITDGTIITADIADDAVTSAKLALSALDCNLTAMFAELWAVMWMKACPPKVVDEPKSTAVVVAVAEVLVRAYKLKPLPKLFPVN